MSFLQISIGLIITFFMTLRPFVYKPVALKFPISVSAQFTSFWLVLGLVITCPIYGYLFADNMHKIVSSPFVFLSIIKGFFLTWMINAQQMVNKESTSSSVFSGFIALAVGSLINNIFFNEGLKIFQILCIAALGFLGVLFYFFGDSKNLSVHGKNAFMVTIFLTSSYCVIDHLTIPEIGWYPHLFISSLAFLLSSVWKNFSWQNFKIIFSTRIIIIAGIIYTVSEFLIIYSLTNILPVSFANLFMRISIPVIMVISALKYKEQSWQKQLAFGSCAIILSMPLFLFN